MGELTFYNPEQQDRATELALSAVEGVTESTEAREQNSVSLRPLWRAMCSLLYWRAMVGCVTRTISVSRNRPNATPIYDTVSSPRKGARQWKPSPSLCAMTLITPHSTCGRVSSTTPKSHSPHLGTA